MRKIIILYKLDFANNYTLNWLISLYKKVGYRVKVK